MDLQDIQDIASNQEVYLRGAHYFHEGRVMQIEWSEDGRCIAAVKGDKDIYRVVVDIGLHESIGYYSCSCQAFRNCYGACKHIVAVLMRIREQKNEEAQILQQTQRDLLDPEKIAENQKKQLRQDLHQLIEWSIEEDLRSFKEQKKRHTEKFHLTPVIRLDEDEICYLSLNVGQTRNYIIRNISDFCRQVRCGEAVVYGKQKPVIHQMEDFEASSRGLLQLILDKEKEMSFWNTLNKSDTDLSEPYTVGREMLTAPAMMDKVLEVWQGQEISFKDAQERKWTVQICFKEKPRLDIDLKAGLVPHEIVLNAVQGEIFFGEHHAYLLQGEKLFLLPAGRVEKLEKFLHILSRHPEGLSLTENEMKDLDANILHPFAEIVHLQAEDELLEAYCAYPLQSRLYLDQTADGSQISGRLSFHYGEQAFLAFDKDISVAGRNRIQEEQIKRTVLKYFPKIDWQKKEVVIQANDEAFYLLLTEGVQELGKNISLYASDTFRKIKIHKMPDVHVNVRLENDWLDLSLESEGISLQEWWEIFQAYRLKKKYFRLKNGDFLHLEEEKIETVASLLDGLQNSKTAPKGSVVQVPNYRALFVERLLQEHPDIHCLKNDRFDRLVQQIQHIQNGEFPVPASLEGVLRDYQKIGYQWLMTMKKYGFGGILADDMGLGKTLQIITLLLYEKQQSEKMKHTLIICPASLIYNWQAEVLRFAPELSTLALVGNSNERQEKMQQISSYDIIITSYDLLRRDVDLYQDFTFDYHILDEAQYIKNQNTHSSRAVRRIKSKQRFALTGTPIENNAAELWSVFDFLMPQYLYSYAQFKERFEKPIVKEGDEKALHQLNQMTAPFLLRRMKNQVLKELPEKNETIIPTEMEKEQRKLYQANLMSMRQDFKMQLEQKGLASSKFMLLSILMRLRQLCCHPKLCYENYKGSSGKLELCMELIKSSVEAGHKILLFSQFTSMLGIIAERLNKEKLEFYCLEGSTPKEKRAEMVGQFQQNQVPIFLISLKAGGTGLNLTSADIVIHYDPWWNLSVQNQATDRVHRIGQKNSVQVYQLITKGSIEEKILHLQKKKQALADSIIHSGSHLISSMSAEEILSLFDHEEEE